MSLFPIAMAWASRNPSTGRTGIKTNKHTGKTHKGKTHKGKTMTFTPEGPGAVLIDGYPLSYQRVGKGPPLVLVHGMITDHGLWDVHVQRLAERFHVVTPTLRYFGASRWPDQGQDFSMDRQADDLGAFIEALDLGPVNLVGWSLGGALALCLAARRPHLIETLLLDEPSRHCQ